MKHYFDAKSAESVKDALPKHLAGKYELLKMTMQNYYVSAVTEGPYSLLIRGRIKFGDNELRVKNTSTDFVVMYRSITDIMQMSEVADETFRICVSGKFVISISKSKLQ